MVSQELLHSIHMEGYMKKKRRLNLSMKGRYFVLNGATLRQYKSKSDSEKNTAVEMEFKVVSVYDWILERHLATKKEKFIFGMRMDVFVRGDDVKSSDKKSGAASLQHDTLYVACQSKEEKDEWVHYIRAACDERSEEANEILASNYEKEEMERKEKEELISEAKKARKMGDEEYLAKVKQKEKKLKSEKKKKKKEKKHRHRSRENEGSSSEPSPHQDKQREARRKKNRKSGKKKNDRDATSSNDDRNELGKTTKEDAIESDKDAWTQHVAPDGRFYYYNAFRKESRWDDPNKHESSSSDSYTASDGEGHPLGTGGQESALKDRLQSTRVKLSSVDPFLDEVKQNNLRKEHEREVKKEAKRLKHEKRKLREEAKRIKEERKKLQAIKLAEQKNTEQLKTQLDKEAVEINAVENHEKEKGSNSSAKSSRRHRKRHLKGDDSVVSSDERNINSDGEIGDYREESSVSVVQRKDGSELAFRGSKVEREASVDENHCGALVVKVSSAFSNSNGNCAKCNVSKASLRCFDCKTELCSDCSFMIHQHEVNHTITLTTVPVCSGCEHASGIQYCLHCKNYLCDSCASFLHRSSSKHHHTRVPCTVSSVSIPYDEVKQNSSTTDIAPNNGLHQSITMQNRISTLQDFGQMTTNAVPQGLHNALNITNNSFQQMSMRPVVCVKCKGFGRDLLVQVQNNNVPICLHCFRLEQGYQYGAVPSTDGGSYGQESAVGYQNDQQNTWKRDICKVCNGFGKDLAIFEGNTICRHCHLLGNKQLRREPTLVRQERTEKSSSSKLEKWASDSDSEWDTSGDSDWD